MPLMRILYSFGQRPVLLWIKRCAPGKPHCVEFSLAFLLLSSVGVACSGLGGNTGGSANMIPTAAPISTVLSALHWCGKASIVFRDAASATVQGTMLPTPAVPLGPANGTPTTITDWSVVKADLGFTIFLPPTLAPTACLQSVSGVLRHAVIGSNFIITYLLPNHDFITFSQASSPRETTFQCSSMTTASATEATQSSAPIITPTFVTENPVQLCSGVKGTTSIIFSTPGSTANLQAIFQQLQPNVNWLPVT